MSNITLIMSDLHIADGHSILDSFGDTQQAAFEGLLTAACSAGPLGQAYEVELVINGDCFDFLTTAPYNTGGKSDISTNLEKLNKIITAHIPFFAALRRFIEMPGRHMTFLVGNHDIELWFKQVQEHITAAICGEHVSEKVSFCPTRFYRPLPDVYIEHGNHYDFWNHAMQKLWDNEERPLDLNTRTIILPVGSHYFQHAAHPVSINYAYFDRFEPSMNSMRQIALLCLINPDIIVETAKLTMDLFSEPRKALTGLAPGEERIPARLFEQTMLDFAAFQQEMADRKPDWVEPGNLDNQQVMAATMIEFGMLREALKLPLVEAVATICTPTTYQMGERVAAGMHAVLKRDPTLRYAIAGHTHMVRIDPVNNGAQSYLNTASWSERLAMPAPGEVNPALVEWFRHPDWENVPLRDVTQFTFAMVNSSAEGPSSASLCVWEGGLKGSYRVLA